MGSGSYSPTDWSSYVASSGIKTKAVDEIYARHLADALNPKLIKGGVREACDGPDHPASTALIMALDVTGSMGPVLDVMAKTAMNTLVTELLDRKPVTDPAIMCMGIGDAEAGDRAPLQVTQFESDIRIQEQLAQLFLEGGGGGNNYESYLLAHYFAARHTKTDCFDKRGKRGYLFTIGDECPTPYLRKQDIERVTGDVVQADLRWDDVLTESSRMYHVYHVVVEQGSYFRTASDRVRREWTEALGQRVLFLPDQSKLAEVIVSAIQINEGVDPNTVVDSWDGSTSVVVRKATEHLVASATDSGEGLVTL
jgi:hypothetical protein